MQGRSRITTFTVILAVVMAVCAVIVGLYMIFAIGAPVGVVIGTMLAAIPVIPLVACYLWLDRYEPEPPSLLALGLGWGGFVAVMVALIVEGSASFVVHGAMGNAVGVAPFAEEFAKGSFLLLLLLFRRQEFDGILDGIVYAGMTGIGFAFVENIEYLGHAYAEGAHYGHEGLNLAVHLFIFRCVFSPFAHPMFTSLTGIGIGIAVGSKNHAVRVIAPIVGYLCAVAAHATWNGFIASDLHHMLLRYLVVMVPAFLMLVGFAIWSRTQEVKFLTTALDDCARLGFLNAAEVPWLVRLPGRRMCRNNAAAVGGPQAKHVMAEYQREAIELAYLHYRYLKGAPPKGYEMLGRQHIDAMAALRPGLVWPAAAPATA